MKKGKYIDYQILLACLSKPVVQKKNEVTADAVDKPGSNNFKPTGAEIPGVTNNVKLQKDPDF